MTSQNWQTSWIVKSRKTRKHKAKYGNLTHRRTLISVGGMGKSNWTGTLGTTGVSAAEGPAYPHSWWISTSSSCDHQNGQFNTIVGGTRIAKSSTAHHPSSSHHAAGWCRYWFLHSAGSIHRKWFSRLRHKKIKEFGNKGIWAGLETLHIQHRWQTKEVYQPTRVCANRRHSAYQG